MTEFRKHRALTEYSHKKGSLDSKVGVAATIVMKLARQCAVKEGARRSAVKKGARQSAVKKEQGKVQ